MKLPKPSRSRFGRWVEAGIERRSQRLATSCSFLPSLLAPSLHLGCRPALDSFQVQSLFSLSRGELPSCSESSKPCGGQICEPNPNCGAELDCCCEMAKSKTTCSHIRSNNDGYINSNLHFRAFSKPSSSRPPPDLLYGGLHNLQSSA